MLNLIGNPNESIQLPVIFLDFMTGVEILVNQYLKIGLASSLVKGNQSRFIPPSGNTILHIFGTWLFDAIHLNRKSFEEGTALSTKILITIMSQKHTTDFLPIYSSSFFSSMKKALDQDGRVLITSITSSTSLFTLSLKGIRCLIPYFVKSILRICSCKAILADHVLPAEHVRRSALDIMSNLICYANHFNETKFFSLDVNIDSPDTTTTTTSGGGIPTSSSNNSLYNSTGSNTNTPTLTHKKAANTKTPSLSSSVNISSSSSSNSLIQIDNYIQLHEIYSNILLSALEKESNHNNIEKILSLTFVWQFETLSKGEREFVKKSLKLIILKIKNKIWSEEVRIRGVRSLSEMAIHYPQLGQKGYVIANHVVESLCKIIISIGIPSASSLSSTTSGVMSSSSSSSVSNHEYISALSYSCIRKWILTDDQWIFNDTHRDTRHLILSVIVHGLGQGKSNEFGSLSGMDGNISDSSSGSEKSISSSQSSSSTSNRLRRKEKRKEADKSSSSSSSYNDLHRESMQGSDCIRKEAKFTLQSILNHLGNFPPASGASIFSSLATEENIIQSMISSEQSSVTSESYALHRLRYFMTDDHVILCFIDRDDLQVDGKPCVCVIVRDATGRYTWDTTLSFLPLQTPQEEENPIPLHLKYKNPFIENNDDDDDDDDTVDSYYIQNLKDEENRNSSSPYIPVTSCFESKSTKQLSEIELPKVMEFLCKNNNNNNNNDKQSSSSSSSSSSSKDSKPMQIVTKQVQNEIELFTKKKYNLDYDIRIHNPSPTKMENECKFNQSRMLLSHLGFLSIENHDKLYPIGMTSYFYSLLKQLDQQSERICIRVGVLYIADNQKEETQWYGNQHGNLDYQQFIATLGWGVELPSHLGYSGTLDTSGSMAGLYAPYWADMEVEMIFQVCTLMPNNSTYPDHSHKRVQSTNGTCIVVWLENLSDFQPALIWKRIRHSALIITVTPLEYGLYRIHLHSKSSSDIVCSFFFIVCT